jgi:hypothetical protein
VSAGAQRCGRCGRVVRASRARAPRVRWVNHALDCGARGELPLPPERALAAVAWELRGAWARGAEVGIRLRGPGRARRVRGRVERVAATGAFAILWDGCGTLHVPVARIAAVVRPHFHSGGDWGPPVEPRREGARRPVELPLPGQLSLDVADGRPEGWEDPREAVQRRRGEGKRRSVEREKSRGALASS